MDATKLRPKGGKGKQLDGLEQAATLYGGRALHGEMPPAIDKRAVIAHWEHIWAMTVTDLNPFQMRALYNVVMAETERRRALRDRARREMTGHEE